MTDVDKSIFNTPHAVAAEEARQAREAEEAAAEEETPKPKRSTKGGGAKGR